MRWLVALPLGSVVPILYFLASAIRFGIDGSIPRSVGGFFFTILVLSSVGASFLALAWYFRSEGRAQKIFTALGYIAGIPVALIVLVILPWFLPPFFSCLFGGSLPLILCTFAGYDFGAKSNIH